MRVGVEEPPGQDRSGHDEQTKGLVAAESSALLVAPLVFGQLLFVGLDAAFDHAIALFRGCDGTRRFTTHQYMAAAV